MMKVGLETLIVEKRKKEVRKIYFEEKFYRFLNNKTHSIKFFQGLILCSFLILYSMKIKEQTRKLAVGCSKHCFEVADGSWRGLKRFSKSIKDFLPNLHINHPLDECLRFDIKSKMKLLLSKWEIERTFTLQQLWSELYLSLSLEIEICNKNVIFHKELPIFHGGG